MRILRSYSSPSSTHTQSHTLMHLAQQQCLFSISSKKQMIQKKPTATFSFWRKNQMLQRLDVGV